MPHWSNYTLLLLVLLFLQCFTRSVGLRIRWRSWVARSSSSAFSLSPREILLRLIFSTEEQVEARSPIPPGLHFDWLRRQTDADVKARFSKSSSSLKLPMLYIVCQSVDWMEKWSMLLRVFPFPARNFAQTNFSGRGASGSSLADQARVAFWLIDVTDGCGCEGEVFKVILIP